MMCSETSPPRISFSHDLGQADANPRRDASLLDMSYDFEFSFKQGQSSSADELFSHGVLKPLRSSLEDAPKAGQPYSHPPNPTRNPKKDNINIPEDLEQNNNSKTNQSKSFWGFKRSNSLNQESKRSLLCSLPEFLKRSNSTGSAPNNNNPKSHQKRQSSLSSSSSSSASSSSSTSSNSSSSSQQRMLPRPPSRKGSSNLGGNGGVRISPVLNVPSPYISRGTAKLLCLSSFLYPDGNEKKQKK